ncbi:MAG: alpha/beta hydrolase [Deltaproteobacteria bacterium]|nr:alpha/beta hydrolase [Deltaproteobacteria bacterium]
MVLAGQFLERPALIPCGELTLEGLYHRGRRAPALLLCPPVDESGMDAPPLAELAWASARAGHASLRFQHRGRGASGGEPDPAQALADAEAALEHLAGTAPGPLAVCGLWSGCETALALLRGHPELRGAALLAPSALPAGEPVAARVLALLPEAGAALDEAAVLATLPGAEVERLAGADARFQAGLSQAARRAVAFLAAGG